MQPRHEIVGLLSEDGSVESDDEDDNQEVSVDSGNDQPSANVGSQDLCEVCMIEQRLCPADTNAFVVHVSHTKSDQEGMQRLTFVPRVDHVNLCLY